MKFSIKNIGMIEEAEIDLNDLVVIAGKNDTGKSTVGKLLFSVIRAFGKYEKEFSYDRNQFIMRNLELMYFNLRSGLNDREILEKLHPSKIRATIFGLDESMFEEQIIDMVNRWKKIIGELEERLSEELVQSIQKKLSQIDELMKLNPDDKSAKVRALNKVFKSEYKNQLDHFYGERESFVKGFDGGNEIFSMCIKNNEVNALEVYDEISYSDAVYIESPFLLGVMEGAYSGDLEQFPLHVKDLFEELRKSAPSQPVAEMLGEEFNDELNAKINRIISGNMFYKNTGSQFLYKKEADERDFNVKLNNIATGIKSLGMIQMLIKSGSLHPRSLLIIDEPEVHLHPKWQIDYAEILVLLSKYANLSIILTSHSPYFIEAIETFSKKYEYEKKTKFYLANKEESECTSHVINVTSNLDLIYEQLSEPFETLEKVKLEKKLGEHHD